jgi:hypothetical protein
MSEHNHIQLLKTTAKQNGNNSETIQYQNSATPLRIHPAQKIPQSENSI